MMSDGSGCVSDRVSSDSQKLKSSRTISSNTPSIVASGDGGRGSCARRVFSRFFARVHPEQACWRRCLQGWRIRLGPYRGQFLRTVVAPRSRRISPKARASHAAAVPVLKSLVFDVSELIPGAYKDRGDVVVRD
jgi:hypothetical protein